jgi:hypothetical protein
MDCKLRVQYTEEDLMPVIKILLVTDDQGGYQRSNSSAHQFHLGEFVQVLNDTTWDGFTIQITRAYRGANPTPSTPQATHPIGADLYDFRFSPTSLAGFDMAFFFSIATKGEDPVSDDLDRQSEAAAVAAFMEAGGGFFAAGDHEDLGASINQHIPRVRSMRRWAYPSTGPHAGPVAPSGTGANRHDTLQSGSDTGTHSGATYPFQFNDQSDDLPQPIIPKTYVVTKSKLFQTTLPHPLLCCPLGRIAVLPDHMHEGWCEVPSDLTRDEDLPGRAGKKEYPTGDDGVQVAPEVIANATVLLHATLNQEFGGSLAISPLTTGAPYSFGVIAAYDGHRANIGRVVVDATWHHFVNINVIGTTASFPGINPAKSKGFYTAPGNTASTDYERIKWYYRNLVYWLIPADRTRLVFGKWAAAVMDHPNWEEFKTLRWRDDLNADAQFTRMIHFAQLAEDYFASARGHCLKYQLLSIILYPIKKLFPWEIWQSILPEVAPWDSNHLADWQPQPEWRQALLPDANLLRQTLLGTIVLAATEILGRYDEVSEKQLHAIQDRTLELLPHHLRIASAQIEAGARESTNLARQFAQLAEGLTGKR